MDAEKIIINPAPGQPKTTIEILEGKAPQRLDEKPPVKIEIEGTISAPARFLEKRREQIKPTENHVIVNREDGAITLCLNEADPYKKGHVVGVICVSAVMQEFGINTGKKWEPNKLGQFFKMNRAFFSDRVQNMQLVSDLKNFTAKVNAVIEKQRDQSGTFKENYSGIVSSNLPSSFSLEIPIIVGQSPETIEVEFYASVDGPNISLELVSPGAKEWLDNEKNTIIDTEITVIESIMPGLPIIEV